MKLRDSDDDFKRALVARYCIYKGRGENVKESRHHRRCANWKAAAYAEMVAMYDDFKSKEVSND